MKPQPQHKLVHNGYYSFYGNAIVSIGISYSYSYTRVVKLIFVWFNIYNESFSVFNYVHLLIASEQWFIPCLTSYFEYCQLPLDSFVR